MFQARFNGPPSQTILIKNRGNNAKLNGIRPMLKIQFSAGGSMFSNARMEYSKDAGGGTCLSGNFDQSVYSFKKKCNW